MGLMTLFACYVGGFWYWATPAEISFHGRLADPPRPTPPPTYVFADTTSNRTLETIYAPVFRMKSAQVCFLDLTSELVPGFATNSPAREPGLENPFALFDEFIEP